MTFIDELLAESEVREAQELVQINRLRADQILAALAVLEQNAADVNKLCDTEISIIEEYRVTELQKIEKKASWLAYQLEQFMRSTDEKTINLPHGSIKLRLGRDKVQVIDMESFVPFAQRKGLLRQVPESFEPDPQKIQQYIKSTGVVPTGVVLTPATNKFSYKTKGNNNGKEETGNEVE